MNAVNKVNSEYINQYQTAELNSTTQVNKSEDAKSTKDLEKDVYERADVKDSVEISSESASAAYTRTTKGLSSDQVRTLKDQMASTQLDMVRKMVESVNQSMKNKLGNVFSKNNSNSSIKLATGAVISASDFAVPSMPANQKDAMAAISDGGVWSVDATASRIVNLSAKIANGDLGMLEKMRDAFLKGYKSAENAWGGKLPEIAQKTYDEVLSRFDKIKSDWSNTAEE